MGVPESYRALLLMKLSKVKTMFEREMVFSEAEKHKSL